MTMSIQKPKSMRDTLLFKIEDAKLSAQAWKKSNSQHNQETARMWEGKLEAFQYALDLLNWKDAGVID